MSKPDTYKRTRVFEGIRKALGADGSEGQRRAAVAERLAGHRVNLVPARAKQSPEALTELFCEMLSGQKANVVRVAKPADIPAKVADLLRQSNLPARIRMGDDPLLSALDWRGERQVTIDRGRAEGDDQASLAHAFAGVAETGTLVFLSGRDNPTTLNFLPETEIAVVEVQAIVGSYEAMWSRLRTKVGEGAMPRTVNFVSGPSRTADIEQTIVMGAHGPRRLHVIVVGG